MPPQSVLARNDPRQYDELADTWWDRSGPFAMLHWIAAARAALIPPAERAGSVLLDLGCGAGLLAPHIEAKGYVHVGIDVTRSALEQARAHGMTVVQGDVLAVPVADESVDVVCAGEILEHVTDLEAAVAESCRVLRPGGLVVLDTLADTAIGKFVSVTVAERIPGAAPRGIHDPRLFVDRGRLIDLYASGGVDLQLRGLRPTIPSMLRWMARRPEAGRMVPTWSTSVLFQAWGRKRPL